MSSFKVILVGGGPVGLTTAHALWAAGIDFVVLEQRSQIVIDAGANLVLQVEGLSALAKFGLLPALEAVSTPLTTVHRVDHKGNDIGNLEFFNYMKKNTGCSPRVISRHDLTEVLWNAFPEEIQARFFTSKKLAAIESLDEGVIVKCVDGTTYSGTIVLGADGAHSAVRKSMQNFISSTDPKVQALSPFTTNYRAIWVRFPVSEHIKPGMAGEVHGVGAGMQIFGGEKTGVLGLYEKLDKPVHGSVRFTDADESAIINRWGHIRLLNNFPLTLHDLYNTRLQSGMISLEEGVLDTWSWEGRIVLLGDAVHKYTPSTGSGCNNGITDAMVLVNLLKKMDLGTDGARRTDLQAAFNTYQDLRFDAVTEQCQRSGQATNLSAWNSRLLKFIDTRIFPLKVVQAFLGSRIRVPDVLA